MDMPNSIFVPALLLNPHSNMAKLGSLNLLSKGEQYLERIAFYRALGAGVS